MAEVQTTTESGEMTQRFIEFVMMQAQNAAHFLGQIPGPSGPAEVNLDLAKLFIDQLIMIRAKTRGNLGADEQAVLNNAISNLQMGFVEVSRGGGAAFGGDEIALDETASSAESAAGESTAVPAPASPETSAPAAEGTASESRKKFTKSYGA